MNDRTLGFGLFLLGCLVGLANADGLMLYALDEVKNATCAREMWQAGEPIVPTFNGELRTDKPPLHYYFMMLAYSVFGVSAWSARLFSGLMSGLTVWLTYRFGRDQIDRRTGLWASLGLTASIHWAVQFHMSVPDPYLIFFVTAALYCFYKGLHRHSLGYLLAMYVSLALGVLAKGPVALGLPGLVFLVYLLWSRQLTWRVLGRLQIPLGAVVFLAIALPWYVLVHRATEGAWTEGFFFKHNFHRFSSSMEGHGGIFLVTFAFVLGGMLPYSVWVPQAVVHAWKRRDPSRDLRWFWLMAALAIVGFFAISRTKLPNYTVPAYPPLALLVADFLAQSVREGRIRRLRPGLWVFFGLSLVLVIGGYIGLRLDPAVSHLNHLALGISVMTLAAGAALWMLYRARPLRMVYALTGGNVLFVLAFFWIIYPPIDDENPVAQSLDMLQSRDAEIVAYRKFNPAFVFNLGHTIPRYKEDSALQRALAGRGETLIITRKKYLDDLERIVPSGELIFKHRDTFERPTTAIVAVPAAAQRQAWHRPGPAQRGSGPATPPAERSAP